MRPDRCSHRHLVRLIVFGVGLTLTACGKTTTSPSTTTTTTTTSSPPTTSQPPVLSVPVVDLAIVNDFLPFGFSSSGRINPTYELRTTGETAAVRAAGPGTVVDILFNPTENDSEVHVRPPDAPEYMVIYDHVISLQVAVGQPVAAGQLLGTVGFFARGIGRTELQVNRTTGQNTVALCPREFGTADFNAAHDAAFARFPARGASVCLASSVQP